MVQAGNYQADCKLTDAGGRLIVEGLKANCSVTWVHLVTQRLRAGDKIKKTISFAVLQEVDAIIKKDPEQRRAEVAAIKQVFCLLCLLFFIISSLLGVNLMIMAALLESFTT